MASSNMKVSSLLVSRIKSFLISYRDEMKNRKPSPTTNNMPLFSSLSSTTTMNVPDPTTANALNTSTVVLRKRTSKKKNSPFDGVPLSNYRIRSNDIQAEVFDWISHYLWLKKCPIELATIVAIKVSSKMNPNEENTKIADSNDMDGINANHKSPTLMDTELNNSVTASLDVPSSLDTLSPSDQSSLPRALCSHEVARQSRELMNDYLEELGSNPDQAVLMVQDYLESPNKNGIAFNSSVHAMKNRRLSMEDRHVIIHNLNKALNLDVPKSYSYYAIFDGHAGIDAASYSTAHLHHYLVESESFRQGNMEQAFREAFEKTDQLYIKRCKEDGIDKLRPSGTTAICALVEDNKTVYLAWAGDSQAILVRNGCHEEIMLPHKPDLDSERIRIQDHGGFVTYSDTWRVNGILSVTRAIGDPEFKPSVIAEPSFSSFEIDPSLDFLVLGCDGLFDNLTGQDITSHVFEFLCKNENKDPEKVIHDVSEYLSQMAVNEGSQDNITSIVIFFKPFEKLVATGYPMEEDHLTDQEEINNCFDSGLPTMPTCLPTINGGHFPYTDFSELPIGANYKLTSEEFIEDSSQQQQQKESNPQDPMFECSNFENNLDKETSDLMKPSKIDDNIINEENSVNFNEQNLINNENHPVEENDSVEVDVCEEDLDSGEEERCQDEFDFVRISDVEQQQKQSEIVVVEEEKVSQPQSQQVTEVEEELNAQSSMIEVEKPAIMEIVNDNKIDSANDNLIIEQPTANIDDQSLTSNETMITNEDILNDPMEPGMISDGNLQIEEKMTDPIVMDDNNPLMYFSSPEAIKVNQESTVIANDQQPLFMNNDEFMMKNDSFNQMCEENLNNKNDVLSISNDDIDQQQKILEPVVENQNPSNDVDFCFVNSVNNESDNQLYPVDNNILDNNGTMMIPSQLLNETQLESALYDQNGGPADYNDKDLLNFSPNTHDVPTDANIVNNSECLEETSTCPKSNFNDSLINKFNNLDLSETLLSDDQWNNSNDITIIEKRKTVTPELIEEPIKLADNNEVAEKVNLDPMNSVPESKNESLFSASEQQNSTSNIDFNNTSENKDVDNLIESPLSKSNNENESIVIDSKLIDEPVIETNHFQENNIELGGESINSASVVENKIDDLSESSNKIVENNLMHMDEIKDNSVSIETTQQASESEKEIPVKEELGSGEKIEPVQTIPEIEVKSPVIDNNLIKSEKPKDDKNEKSIKKINSISKLTSKAAAPLSKVASTAAKTTVSKLATATAKPNATSARIGTTKTTSKPTTTGVTKVAASRPISSVSSSRLTTKPSATTTTTKPSSASKTESKKPTTNTTSVASKLNTRPTTTSTRPAATSKTPSTIPNNKAPVSQRSGTSLINKSTGSGSKTTVPATKTSTRPAVSSTASKPSTTTTARVPLSRPTATKLNTTNTAKPATSTTTTTAKKPVAGTVASKIGSFRKPTATTTSTTNKAQSVNKSSSTLKPSPATAKTTTTSSSKLLGTKSSNVNKKVVNGEKNNTQINETKKTISKNMSATISANNNKLEDSVMNGNGTMVSSSAKPILPTTTYNKRTNIINVENSLKQELEDAEMNEMNNAAAAAAAAANNNHQLEHAIN